MAPKERSGGAVVVLDTSDGGALVEDIFLMFVDRFVFHFLLLLLQFECCCKEL